MPKTKSQELVEKATAEGSIPPPRLQLATQITDEAGNKKGVNGTGPHEVKFISDKIVKGKEYQTQQERLEVEYTFEEKGQKKRYSVPVKDKKGELNYFVQRMAEVEIGEVITLEYKRIKGSVKGYIDFQRIVDEPEQTSTAEVSDDDIPIVEDDEEGKEINVEEIPF